VRRASDWQWELSLNPVRNITQITGKPRTIHRSLHPLPLPEIHRLIVERLRVSPARLPVRIAPVLHAGLRGLVTRPGMKDREETTGPSLSTLVLFPAQVFVAVTAVRAPPHAPWVAPFQPDAARAENFERLRYTGRAAAEQDHDNP